MIEQLQEQKEAFDIEDMTDVVADTGYFTEKAIIQNKDNEDCRPVVSPAAEGKNCDTVGFTVRRLDEQPGYSYISRLWRQG